MKLLTLFFTVLSVAFLSTSSVGAQLFWDVPFAHPYYDAIGYMQGEKIVGGYSDGSFHPDSQINRAELMKILIAAHFDTQTIEECGSNTGDFFDVPRGAWFGGYVCVARRSGIVRGYSDGKFRPGQPINFAEASKMIAITYGLPVGEGDVWYLPYYETLAELDAIPDTILSFQQFITRGELAEIIARLEGGIETSPHSRPPLQPPLQLAPPLIVNSRVLTRDFFGMEPAPSSTRVGMESAVRTIFDAVAALGVRHFGVNGMTWEVVEPNPPVDGKHSYNFTHYDNLAREADRVGIKLEITFQVSSSWGTEKVGGGIVTPATSPVKPEHLENYRAFIREMVSRYNGPSSVRLEGLSGPVISYLMVGNEIEVPFHWSDNGSPENPATPAAYYNLVDITAQEAKAVDPSIIIARGSSNFGDLWEDGPTEEEFWSRIDESGGQFAQNFHDLQPPAFREDRPFDVYGLHPNRGTMNTYYSGIYAQRNLASPKRFIAEDMRSVLTNYSSNLLNAAPDLEQPWPDANQNRVPDVIEVIAAGPNSPGYYEARTLYEREQSNTVIKKIALSAAAGYESIFLSHWHDLTQNYPDPEWWFAGFVVYGDDKNNPIERFRPAYHTYRTAIQKLVGAEVLGYFSPKEGVHVVRFRKNNENFVIAWSEREDQYIDFSDYLSSTSLVFRFPTEEGETDFVSVSGVKEVQGIPIPILGSLYSILLGNTPLLIME